jgi:transcriptional regulator with XRE-family HTH domain
MAKKTAPLLPSTDEVLTRFGDRLRMARLRRRLPAGQVAQRAGMSPMTLRSIERGGAGVTIGAWLAVMQVLGVERDLNLLASADPAGRELQDSRLLPLTSKPERKPASTASAAPTQVATTPVTRKTPRQIRPAAAAGDWVKKGGFASSGSLAALIKAPPAAKKKR